MRSELVGRETEMTALEECLEDAADSLQMLVTTGGKERTEAETGDLLAASGFRLTRAVPTRSPMVVVVGVPE
ncbi:MAG: hypothetical protein M3445_04390 [Actinomycetota bacterium]|nr:hypothetical protein [Actinomycetota bacterium]